MELGIQVIIYYRNSGIGGRVNGENAGGHTKHKFSGRGCCITWVGCRGQRYAGYRERCTAIWLWPPRVSNPGSGLASVFSLEGIRGHQQQYIKWLEWMHPRPIPMTWFKKSNCHVGRATDNTTQSDITWSWHLKKPTKLGPNQSRQTLWNNFGGWTKRFGTRLIRHGYNNQGVS